MRDWEQTGQGGSEGWIKHKALGTALEHPVPRNIKADFDGSAMPPFSATAAIFPAKCATVWKVDCKLEMKGKWRRRPCFGSRTLKYSTTDELPRVIHVAGPKAQ